MRTATAPAAAPAADSTTRLNGASHASDSSPFADREAVEAYARQRLADGCSVEAVHADLKGMVADRRMRIGDQLTSDQLRKLAPGKRTSKGRAGKKAATEPHQAHQTDERPTYPQSRIIGADSTFPRVQITIIEDANGPVAKRFRLDEDGNLQNQTKAQIYEGKARVVGVAGLEGLLAALESLKPNEAAIYGVIASGATEAPVVTQETLKRIAPVGAIARDQEHFVFSEGKPGVLYLDYDPQPGARPLTPDELDAILCKEVPGWGETARAYRPSSSSFIRCADDGRVLRDAGGLRAYAVVDNAAAIPDVGAFIFQRLFDAGHGWIYVSASGQMLARTLSDASVHQAERLDFAAGPDLGDGLERFAPPALVKSGKPLLATTDIRPELTMEQWRKTSLVLKSAKRKAEGEAAEARKIFIADRMAHLAKGAMTKARQRHLRSVLTRAVERRILSGDFMLICADGTRPSAADLLADPDKWIGVRFGDPLEPDYRNDRRIAVCRRGDDGKLYIFSHAHGGLRYSLVRESAEIHLAAGEQPRVVDEALAVLRGKGEVFERGGELVRLDDGGITPVSDEWILDYLGRNVVFTATRLKDKEPKPVRVDTPPWLARRISAKRGERGLRELRGVVTAPTMRPDGSLLTDAGYDEATGLLLKPGKWPTVPENPTEQEMRQAMEALWRPFGAFPFVDTVSRSIWLATLLTAIIRQSLPLAPATSVDAPEAGTGKTLLGKCALTLTGMAPTAIPECRDEEEVRKRLLSALRTGQPGILFDNIRGQFGSASIEALLTAEFYSDRLLGASQLVSLPTAVLMLFSGNNFRPTGDLWRRILTCRIDAKSDAPERRSFTLEPLIYCREHRQELVAAGLALLRGFVLAGKPRTTPDKLASFEMWDTLVRQCVIWLGAKRLLPDIVQDGGRVEAFFKDPAEGISRAKEAEPERRRLAAFCAAVSALNGNERWCTNDLVKAVSAEGIVSPSVVDLREVLIDISEDRAGKINARRLGNWISGQVDKRVGVGEDAARAAMWVAVSGAKKANRVYWAIDQERTSQKQEGAAETNSPTSPNSPSEEFEPGAWEDPETEAMTAKGEFGELGEFDPADQFSGGWRS